MSEIEINYWINEIKKCKEDYNYYFKKYFKTK